jgi:DNA-binding NarL/FixJ family response regulator
MTIRVLLADDHAMFRDGLKALLALTPDIRVIAEVGNGGEAARRVQDLKPDVALMDLSMPELNGIEAARILHVKCPATRVVILSMHSSSEHVSRAFAAGAAGYLLKESAGAELVAAVRAVHVGRRYVSSAIAAQQAAVQTAVGRAGPLESLSGRERQVLQLVVEGHSSAEIARRVHLSPKSVDTYRSRLMKKLGVGDVPALVKFAIQHGITPLG